MFFDAKKKVQRYLRVHGVIDDRDLVVGVSRKISGKGLEALVKGVMKKPYTLGLMEAGDAKSAYTDWSVRITDTAGNTFYILIPKRHLPEEKMELFVTTDFTNIESWELENPSAKDEENLKFLPLAKVKKLPAGKGVRVVSLECNMPMCGKVYNALVTAPASSTFAGEGLRLVTENAHVLLPKFKNYGKTWVVETVN